MAALRTTLPSSPKKTSTATQKPPTPTARVKPKDGPSTEVASPPTSEKSTETTSLQQPRDLPSARDQPQPAARPSVNNLHHRLSARQTMPTARAEPVSKSIWHAPKEEPGNTSPSGTALCDGSAKEAVLPAGQHEAQQCIHANSPSHDNSLPDGAVQDKEVKDALTHSSSEPPHHQVQGTDTIIINNSNNEFRPSESPKNYFGEQPPNQTHGQLEIERKAHEGLNSSEFRTPMTDPIQEPAPIRPDSPF
jgi:hypothetical protein